MKMFLKVNFVAVLLTMSLGTYAAAPKQQKPERKQWQKEAEAFLQGLHKRTGQQSPVQTELGQYPATIITRTRSKK